MNSLHPKARFRQRVIRYSERYGVTEASIRFRCPCQAIYKWKARYDGHWKSLIDRSRRPRSHPNQHTQEEKEMIMCHWYHNILKV